MTEAVKNFIETNYELLDSDPNNFFMTAYNGLSIQQQGELIDVLNQAGVDFEQSRYAVLRFILTMNFEDLERPVSIQMYVNRYLVGILGYDYAELSDIIIEESNEFDVDIVFEASSFFSSSQNQLLVL